MDGAFTPANTTVQAAAPDEPPAQVIRKSVVVLPFADESTAGDQDYFCRGAAQEIIHALINLNIPVLMPSVDEPYGACSGASDSSMERTAAITIAGSVRKAGNSYRIFIHLTDRVTGRASSETIERNMVDVFSLQEEIARIVVGEIRNTL